jgi:hypothetical protein
MNEDDAEPNSNLSLPFDFPIMIILSSFKKYLVNFLL